MSKIKGVTNLLTNISKVRDILDEGNLDKIQLNQFLIIRTKDEIIRQVKKYIMDNAHETDFNHEDIRALSDGLFDASDRCIKMRYSNLYKRLTKNKPVEMEHFQQLCNEMANPMYFDKHLRMAANELAQWAITMWVWSETDYRKDFMKQIEEHIRSFL